MTNENKLNNPLLWSFILSVTVIVLFVIQWISLNKNITEIQNLNKQQVKSNNDVTPFYFEFKKTKDKQIILNPEEFKKMYEHVNALAEKVSEESKRTQDFITQDIDRLNLYMAIGIGFIAILGVFVPILVNVLSVDDLKKKQTELDKEQKLIKNHFDNNKDAIQQSIIDSKEAIAKSKEALLLTSKINATEKRVEILDHSTAKISTLILQQSINRYFNVIPYIVLNFDKERFLNIINGIKSGFVECDCNTNHSIIEDDNLKTVISDFSYEINSARSLTVALNKEMYDLYIELSKVLNKHINVINIDEEIKSNKNILDILDKLIEAVTKFYAKT